MTAGLHDLTQTYGHEQERIVSSSIVHSYFDPITLENDIALLVLQSPLNFNAYVSAASFPSANYELVAYEVCTIAGWGTLRQGGKLSDVLMKVYVPYVEYEDCEDSYNWAQDMSDYFICAGEDGKDSCQGDSGGPLFCNGDVYGISSWGIGCGLYGYPGVYTKVTTYLSWIAANAY